jgi:hypothetical protein
MKNHKFFYGILAVAFALSLAGADMAAAYCSGGVCTRDSYAGSDNYCGRSKRGACTNYQSGQCRRNDRGQQQCQRGSNCPVTQPNAPAATQPAPAPANQ